MLGTRIILMGLDGMPGGIAGEPNAEMLCAANHAIPLFWLLAFDASEVEYYAADNTIEQSALQHVDGARYPFLIGYTTDLVQRLQKRFTYLKPHLIADDALLLERWLCFISELEHPILAIDTYELWCNMSDPDMLDKEITELLIKFQKLNEDSSLALLTEMTQAGEWANGNGIALAGFGW